MSRRRKAALIAGSLFAAYLAAGFFALPPLLRSVLRSKLSEALRRPVWVEQVRLNPLALSLTVRGVTVGEPGGASPFAYLGELYVNAESSSLWRRGLVVREARLSRPYVHVTRLAAGRYNFSDLLEPKPAAAPDAKKAAAPPRLALGNLQISDGAADFSDNPMGKEHRLRGVALTVPFLSNFPAYVETFVEPALAGRINGEAFSLRGSSKPFANSLETSVAFELRDLDLPRYVEYVPRRPSARLPSARLDARLRAAYVQYRDRGPSLTLGGEVALREVALDDEEGAPLLRLPRASVAFGPVEVFSRTARVLKVSVESPDVRLASDRAGRWNWSRLRPEPAPAQPDAEPSETAPAEPLSYRVDEFTLSSGRLTVEDGSRAGPFRAAVTPIDLTVQGLTSAGGEPAQASLDLKTDGGESAAVRSLLSLSPLRAEGQASIEGVRLARYAPYYRAKLLADLTGTLAASTRFTLAKAETLDLRLGGLAATLRDFTAGRQGEKKPFARLPSLEVAETSLDLTGRTAALGSVSLRKGDLSLRRSKAGAWNLQGLSPPAPQATTKQAAPQPAPKPWALDLAKLTIRELDVRMADDTPPHPANLSLSRITLDASGLSTRRGRRGRLSLGAGLNRRGSLAARGGLALAPLGADLAVAVKSVDLTPFQPYVEDRLRALVTGGALSADGVVTVAPGKGGKPTAGYRGDVLLSGFAASDAATGEPIVAFDSLSLSRTDVRQEPPTVKIDGVALTDFSAAVTVNADGTLNLREVVETPEEAGAPSAPAVAAAPAAATAATAPAAARPPATVQVNTVTLQGGRVRFTDHHVKPAYVANLVDLGGRVSGLASEESRLADVDVRAKLDDAPLAITGKVNPLIQSPYVDLKVSFQGADLSPTTPYTGRFVGYTVQQGKLFLDVQYRIARRQLDAQNAIVLDQFFLGDKVESPQATKLPVKLGLALLRDRNGQIRLDLPVSGSLDDPKFRVGKIVWQTLLNVLEKAVLSPFALLGSLFGGGPELGYLEFPAGSVEVTEAGAGKVARLAKALHERPALKLEIEGRSAPEEDRRALHELFFLRKLKAQKAKDVVRAGQDVASVDALPLAAEERVKYLAAAYKAEKFPKPRNLLGLEKDIPPEEKEKLLRSHIQVTEGDLSILAQERARNVREALLKTGLVDADRVFVVEGKDLGKDREGKAAGSRVDFGLE